MRASGEHSLPLRRGLSHAWVRSLGHEVRTWWITARYLARTTRRAVARTTLAMTLLAVVLGLFIAAHLQTRAVRQLITAESRRESALITIQRLEAEQADLKRQIADLRATIAARQEQAALHRGALQTLTAELARQKLLAGLVPVRGPGIRVVLDDSPVKTIPPQDDPSLYIVHEYQLRDIVNTLWAGGAEAIAINGERIVSTTSIYCVGSTILINDTRTSPPYEFLAVGDPNTLEATLNSPQSLRALKNRVKAYGLQFTVSRLPEVTIPAFTGSLDIRVASPPDGTVPLRSHGRR